MNEFIDLEVSGVSQMPGGTYGDVEISGAGKIEGNLRCKSLDISGAGKVNGDVICDGDVDSSGAGSINGSLVAENLDSSGAFTVKNGCTILDLLDVSGSFRCEGPLTAHRTDLSGAFQCSGDVSCEEFEGECVCEIDGLLNAEVVDLKLAGNSSIGAIGGSRISVCGKKRGWLLGVQFGTLSTATVEGDEIYLEHTIADVVRGKTVEIGPGCRIRRVEYGESLHVAADASVPEKVQI